MQPIEINAQDAKPARNAAKQAVADFWEDGSCGEHLYLDGKDAENFQAHREIRYQLEPEILTFMDETDWKGKRVLEIGVGLGSDHQELAERGAILSGIDLTARAIANTKQRFAVNNLQSDLKVGDAENLPFDDATFDIVYSWGVIHCSPDTPKAAREILRVLKPGGKIKVMIYNKWSLIGLMLWGRYGLLAGKPFMSLAEVYDKYLESPGTKCYTPAEGAELFKGATVKTSVVLTHGDLLESAVGQRHRGFALDIARKLWPRWLLRRIAGDHGLFLLIDGHKAS